MKPLIYVIQDEIKLTELLAEPNNDIVKVAASSESFESKQKKPQYIIETAIDDLSDCEDTFYVHRSISNNSNDINDKLISANDENEERNEELDKKNVKFQSFNKKKAQKQQIALIQSLI